MSVTTAILPRIYLFLFFFVVVVAFFFSLLRKRKKNHEVRWAGKWGGAEGNGVGKKYDQNILYITFDKKF